MAAMGINSSLFLASAYEGGWPVLSLVVLFSHWQCTVIVLIIAELARVRIWNRNLEPNFFLFRNLNPAPVDWQRKTLKTKPLRTPPHPNIDFGFIALHWSQGSQVWLLRDIHCTRTNQLCRSAEQSHVWSDMKCIVFNASEFPSSPYWNAVSFDASE